MINTQTHGNFVQIRLARPPVNALNPELLSQLAQAIEAADQQRAHGIVLTGGAKVFSAGLDVPYLMTLDRIGLADAWGRFFHTAHIVAGSPIPIVSAIAGHCPAGGCVLALCGDYRIMARGHWRIGLNETQVGLAVPDAIQALLRRVVGPHRAERLMVAGAMIEAEYAHQIGLVDELADADQLLERALAWLESLDQLPRGPMLHTRRIARADIQQALSGFDSRQLDQFIDAWYSSDTQNAMKTLLAKLGK